MDQQVSAVDVCPVCKAKEQGRTPPRRKCTCNSGKTVTRAREPVSFNRNQERQSRELHYCREGLVDHEDPYSKCEAAACLGAECDCKAWRRFELKLYNACRLPGHATRNVSAARDLLTGSAAQSLRERYAASMDEEQRNRLADACEFGDMELLRCLLDIGSNASDRCIYWPDPEEEQVGVVATPLYIAAAGGKPDVITFLKDQGADQQTGRRLRVMGQRLSTSPLRMGMCQWLDFSTRTMWTWARPTRTGRQPCMLPLRLGALK